MSRVYSNNWLQLEGGELEGYYNEAMQWVVYKSSNDGFWYGFHKKSEPVWQIGPYDTREDAMNWCLRVQLHADFVHGREPSTVAAG